MKPEMKNIYSPDPCFSACGLYNSLDYCRMLEGAFNDNEMERFVQHCEECDDCSRALWEFQKVKISEQEAASTESLVQEDNVEYLTARIQEQDNRLIRRSLDYLDKLRGI